jgi:hypothetical protein
MTAPASSHTEPSLMDEWQDVATLYRATRLALVRWLSAQKPASQ